MNFFALVADGGFVMYPLLIFSVIIWAITFERLWFLSKFTKSFELLNGKAKELGKGKIEQLEHTLDAAPEILKESYWTLASTKGLISNDDEEKLGRRLSEVHMGLKKYLWMLASIASVAPFIGLFGTVVGIIRSFDDIAKSGKGGFSVVAAGLSEALIATAAGIIVAVIAVLFYNYFINRINGLHFQFKNRFADLISDLKKGSI